MRNTISRHISTKFLLVFAYFIVAAASFHGYFTKWGLRDTDPRFSINLMLEGTAARPFVYRQLIPQVANIVDRETLPSIKEEITNTFKPFIEDTYASSTMGISKSKYMFRYIIVYILTFASLLTSMFLLREICIEVSGSKITGTVAPISFALILPLIFTRGGYFYDFFELMFMSSAFLLTLRQNFIWILPITLLATLNKESFLLFIFTLIPLLIRPFMSRKKLLAFIFSNFLIAAIVNFIVKSKYALNSGDNIEYQLVENIKFYANPLNYLFSFEWIYGVFVPKGFSIFILLTLLIVVLESWPSLAKPIKQHTLFALAINIPLLVLFCWKDELRNLSMLFIAFTIMISIYLKNLLDRNVERQGAPRFSAKVNQGERDDKDPSLEGTKY